MHQNGNGHKVFSWDKTHRIEIPPLQIACKIWTRGNPIQTNWRAVSRLANKAALRRSIFYTSLHALWMGLWIKRILTQLVILRFSNTNTKWLSFQGNKGYLSQNSLNDLQTWLFLDSSKTGYLSSTIGLFFPIHEIIYKHGYFWNQRTLDNLQRKWVIFPKFL